MEVITAHTNADFDTFASMVAAKLLYPDARLVFPGSLEKKLAKALEEIELPYTFDRAKDIELESVTLLILVDVSGAARIGRFGEIIGRAEVEVHIYDHHPPPTGDTRIRPAKSVNEPYGSTTTILTHIISKRGLDLTETEATILMAGIYEDTGSLIYPSTTTKDYEAASFLLAHGADLLKVSDMLSDELTPEEVSILNDFLHSETTYTVGGVEVVVAEAYMESYTGDIAGFAHKIRDIEGMDTLFVLVDSGDRVHMVARSRSPEVDAGAIARMLGGGGHANAASATIKDVTIIEAREALLKALTEALTPRRTAADIMSFPAITIGLEANLDKAMEHMRRYNINAMPVVKDWSVEGVITRQVADKAIYHGLGSSPVGDYMTTGCDRVAHDTSIDEIREKVVLHGQRLLPVERDGRIAGVITRTDLMKLMREELKGVAPGEKAPILKKLLRERLPQWLIETLRELGRTAEALGLNAYVVGGFVRDLILRRDNLDVDIVVEGAAARSPDAIAFAREFAKSRDLRVRTHSRFRTAVLIFPDGFKIDVATARLEYYKKPGSLPFIEQSSLKLDLYRRDFIINTLALALNPASFGELIDFFGARRDIADKKIRVLHNLSFVEDPTRALRAVRFSEKFGFAIERHTLNLIKNSIRPDVFEHLSGARLMDELRNIMMEDDPARALERLGDLGLLKFIHNGLGWDEALGATFERAREALTWLRLTYAGGGAGEGVEDWLVLFLVLTGGLKEGELLKLAHRLSISGKKRSAVIASRAPALRALGRMNAGLARKNSAIYKLLKMLPTEAVIYLMAIADKESVRAALSNYIIKLRDSATLLKGGDLLRMGVKEGSDVGTVLDTLFSKRLDNELLTKADEEEFVKGFLKSSRARAEGSGPKVGRGRGRRLSGGKTS
jgi:tRNA nucleotidyltransferase (CCA-adding enzyme)